MKRVVICLVAGLMGLMMLFSSIPVSADGMKTISAKALTDHECDLTEWHFVITQIEPDESAAPASISVTWANGASADVPLDKFTGGTAHYSTSANLDSTVVDASAEIYSSWSGQFNLSHGPCEATATPTEVIPTATPTEKVTPTKTPKVTPTVTEPVDETPTATPVPHDTGSGFDLPLGSLLGILVLGIFLVGVGFLVKK